MSPATQRPRKTLEDYLALPDDVRAELIDGELYMTPAPSGRHQHIVLSLGSILQAFTKARSLGLVLTAPFDVHLPSGDVVQPDVLLLRGVAPADAPDVLRGVPDIAVEIVSPTHTVRDRIVKRDLYARNHVPEYWIVDPGEPSIEVLRHEDGAYVPAGFFTSDAVLVSPSLPGFQVPLGKIFEA